MSDQFRFKVADNSNTNELHDVLAITSKEFFTKIPERKVASTLAETIKKCESQGEKNEVFYLEHKATSKPVCMCIVKHRKGMHKAGDRSSEISSIPNVDQLSIKYVTLLCITYVVTLPQYRNLGLANKLIDQTIEYVEKELITHNIETSDDSKPDSFKAMVMQDDKSYDPYLASYYLGKKYFWVLYSAIGTFYERFGFKSLPLSFYKVPTTIADSHEQVLNNLIDTPEGSSHMIGKRLRLLHGSKPQDRDIISFAMQCRELDILTELNKLTFHSELSGGRKSLSSLTNIGDLLNMTKINSQTELTPISQSKQPPPNDPANTRRRSSVQFSGMPSFAIKPSILNIENHDYINREFTKELPDVTPEQLSYNDIQGAIFTNDLQHKSYYIIWLSVIGKLYVIGVGELQFEMLGSASPANPGGAGSKRVSSFTGMNELGAYNFQDLDILFGLACRVARNRNLDDNESVYVAVNDLPNNFPATVLNDYFLNYLPKAFENVEEESSSAAPSKKVQLINDSTDALHVLPMVRRFGNKSSEFDLDWIGNGMWSWV